MKQYEVTLKSGKKIFGDAAQCAAQLDIVVSSFVVYARAFRNGNKCKSRKIANIEEFGEGRAAPKNAVCDEDCFNCKYPDCIWHPTPKEKQETINLPPCPCCGAASKLDVLLGKKYTHYRVSCSQTGSCGLTQNMFDTKEEAIAAWSRRAHERQAD